MEPQKAESTKSEISPIANDVIGKPREKTDKPIVEKPMIATVDTSDSIQKPTVEKSSVNPIDKTDKTVSDKSSQTNSTKNKEETTYFHQFDFEKSKKIPPSLVIVQDKNDVEMAMVSTVDKKGNKKLDFKELDKVLHQDSGDTIELFSNKDLLSAAIDGFKGGVNKANLMFDKVYVAVHKPQAKVKEWLNVRKEAEKAKVLFKDTEIPFSALEKVGIDRNLLTRKDIVKLQRGEFSQLIDTNLKSGNVEFKNVPAFTIKLERTNGNIEARLTFKKDALDISKDKIGKALSQEQKIEILKTGSTYDSVYNKDTGVTKSEQITWNKDTNVLEKKEVKSSALNIKEVAITHGIELSKKDINHLVKGEKVVAPKATNPINGKSENVVLELNKNNEIKPVFTLEIEKKKEKTVEFKER